MNDALIKNWNRVVKHDDTIFFLGDFGRLSLREKRRLHGNISYIRGNHDLSIAPKQRIVTYKQMVFLLIHDPEDYTGWFTGDWIIHGHTHGHTPHIDKKKKRINVSVEVIDYKPINLHEILEEIRISQNNNENIQNKIT